MKVVFSSDRIDVKNVKKRIDVFVFNSSHNIDSYVDTDIDVCIFDKANINNLYKLKKVHNAVSCGMETTDSVTFSSISEDSAIVCIRRQILFSNKIISPCEFKAPFNNDLSLYMNLVKSLVWYLSRKEIY